MQNLTPKMSLNEYQESPKSLPIKKSNLKEGRIYFIESKYSLYVLSNGDLITHTVIFKGKFIGLTERPNYGGPENTTRTYAEFKNVELSADPDSLWRFHPTSLPSIFDTDEKKQISVFKEDHSPNLNDQLSKLSILEELRRYIAEKKMEQIDYSPICFIGEDYREARDRFKCRANLNS